jgi:ABC-type multidrug transport system ATPase subunit
MIHDRVVAADSVSRVYHSGRGVHDVSFEVQAGECLALLGGNGSGKTTLMRLISGLDRPSRGTVRVFGTPPFSSPAAARRRWGVAQDTPAYWPELTGRDHLFFFLGQYGIRGEVLAGRVGELLEMGDLSAHADEPMKTYSFGMRRKMQVLAALGHDPELLILDEPCAGADVTFLSRLSRLVRERRRRGKTTCVADNNADWLSVTASHALLLAGGSIAAGGSVSELMRSIGARTEVEVRVGGAGFHAVPAEPWIGSFACRENRLTALIEGDSRNVGRFLNWITVQGESIRFVDVRTVTLREALERQVKDGDE